MSFEELRKKYGDFIDANAPKDEPVTQDEWARFQESLAMIKIKVLYQAVNKAVDFLGSIGIGTMKTSNEPFRNAKHQVEPDAIPGASEDKSLLTIGLMRSDSSPLAGFDSAIYIHFVTIPPHLSIFMYATDPKTGTYAQRGRWPVPGITAEDVTSEMARTIDFILSSVAEVRDAK